MFCLNANDFSFFGYQFDECLAPGNTMNSNKRPADLNRFAKRVVSVKKMSNSPLIMTVGDIFIHNLSFALSGNKTGSFISLVKSLASNLQILFIVLEFSRSSLVIL